MAKLEIEDKECKQKTWREYMLVACYSETFGWERWSNTESRQWYKPEQSPKAVQ